MIVCLLIVYVYIFINLPLDCCKSTENGMVLTHNSCCVLIDPSQVIRLRMPLPVATKISSRKQHRLQHEKQTQLLKIEQLHKSYKKYFQNYFSIEWQNLCLKRVEFNSLFTWKLSFSHPKNSDNCKWTWSNFSDVSNFLRFWYQKKTCIFLINHEPFL